MFQLPALASSPALVVTEEQRLVLIERHKKLLIEERPKQIAAKNNKDSL